ncbi:hypothetical protein JCM19235_5401 [Vibrio maritimus]|uniref:Uncharacterized protein n=1 Tax=Vibrio maritimus TaxID=990268 RepID=A0A090SBC1_9VIBR|nr:hypothetical protein JCM19235_5401 [Vibrio maritimus]
MSLLVELCRQPQDGDNLPYAFIETMSLSVSLIDQDTYF